MLNRRAFIQATALVVPLASCTRKETPSEVTAVGNLNSQQMAAVRKSAGQFEGLLETVRKTDVAYSVEPRFYPSH